MIKLQPTLLTLLLFTSLAKADFQDLQQASGLAPLEGQPPTPVCGPPIIVPPVIANDPFACAIRKQIREIQIKAAAEDRAKGCPVVEEVLRIEMDLDKTIATLCGET